MLHTKFDEVSYHPGVVKEAYFGSSKNLEAGVKALETICDKINNVGLEFNLVKLNINESPENVALENALKKEFGFSAIHIYWDHSSAPNAYTVMGGAIFMANPNDGVSESNRQSKRYYDSRHEYHCVIVVMMNLVRKMQMTPRETMAFILHEVGHNFDNLWTTSAVKFINFIQTYGMSDITTALMKFGLIPFSAFIQNKLPVLSKFGSLIQDLYYHLSILPDIIFDPNKVIFGLLLTPAEYYADDFAKTYGFGPDFASGIAKFDDKRMSSGMVKSAVYSIPVIRTLYDCVVGPIEFMGQLVDPHPFNENRIKAVEKNLEKDYADPQVPKSLKPEIKKQLEQVKKIREANNAMEGRQDLIFTYLRKQLFK